MVGVLEPLKEEIGEELREVLSKAGVSDEVIEGLLNPRSSLGKLKLLAEKFFPFCEKLVKGEIKELPFEGTQPSKNFLVRSCLDSENIAKQIVELL